MEFNTKKKIYNQKSGGSMNYEKMNNNKLQLVGKVMSEPKLTHQVFGEGFYETTISVARLSEQEDIIPITISERLLTKHGIQVGDTIGVVGQFRSYNKLDGEKSRLMLTGFVRDLLEETYGQNTNNVEITGYICKPPIYRTTPFKREICDVLIAVNRAYDKSDYIPCIMWGRNARFVQNMQVGEKLNIVGRIQSRKYLKSIGGDMVQERVAYELSVSKVIIADDSNIENFEIASDRA